MFLQGKRVDRDVFSFNLRWEPVLQYVVDFKYVFRNINNLFEGRRLVDNWIYLRAVIEL